VTDLEHAQALDQYFTRPLLAKTVVEWAGIQPGQRVLEPSCGAGDLVRWMPEGATIHAMDVDRSVFSTWDEATKAKVDIGFDAVGDFLAWRTAPSDCYDLAVMNPPYGYVGKGKARQAADRLHVQHALRMAPEVICLVRANFLWGQERYSHILRFAEVVRMAVLTHRPSFHGPALLPGQDAARHDFAVYHLRRAPDRMLREEKVDAASVEFWTQDWRLAA